MRTKRTIGPRMLEIQEYVEEHPGCTMLAAVESLTYHGGISRQYGYRAVYRAVRAHLIRIEPRADKVGCWRCCPVRGQEG